MHRTSSRGVICNTACTTQPHHCAPALEGECDLDPTRVETSRTARVCVWRGAGLHKDAGQLTPAHPSPPSPAPRRLAGRCRLLIRGLDAGSTLTGWVRPWGQGRGEPQVLSSIGQPEEPGVPHRSVTATPHRHIKGG